MRDTLFHKSFLSRMGYGRTTGSHVSAVNGQKVHWELSATWINAILATSGCGGGRMYLEMVQSQQTIPGGLFGAQVPMPPKF